MRQYATFGVTGFVLLLALLFAGRSGDIASAYLHTAQQELAEAAPTRGSYGYAETSSPEAVLQEQPAPSLSNAVTATGVNFDTGEPMGAADTFNPNTPLIYLVADATGPAETEFNARWVLVQGDGLSNHEFADVSLTLESDLGADGWIWFRASPPEGEWWVGSYEIMISINGQDAATVPFEVVPAPPAPGPPPRPDTDPLAGPLDGTLTHDDDEFIEERLLEVDVADLYVEATFFNPYSPDDGLWDYGFIIRNSEPGSFHVVFIDSTGTWYHWVRTSSTEPSRNIASGTSDLVDTGEQGSNLLRVAASGDTGWLFINDELTATLDLSGHTESGTVSAITGFFSGDEIPGEATRFEGLTLWDLEGEALGPSPTPVTTPTPIATTTPPLLGHWEGAISGEVAGRSKDLPVSIIPEEPLPGETNPANILITTDAAQGVQTGQLFAASAIGTNGVFNIPEVPYMADIDAIKIP